MEETGSRRYLLLRVIESETFGNGVREDVVVYRAICDDASIGV